MGFCRRASKSLAEHGSSPNLVLPHACASVLEGGAVESQRFFNRMCINGVPMNLKLLHLVVRSRAIGLEQAVACIWLERDRRASFVDEGDCVQVAANEFFEFEVLTVV
jgi:hypothetical protein